LLKLGEWEKALEMYKADERQHQLSGGEERSEGIATPSHSHASSNTLSSMGSVGREELLIHQMKCLEALGRWTPLSQAGEAILLEEPSNIPPPMHHVSGSAAHLQHLNTTLNEMKRRQRIAQMAARGAWGDGDYERMEKFSSFLNQNTQDGSFLRSVIAVRNGEYKRAAEHISKVGGWGYTSIPYAA